MTKLVGKPYAGKPHVRFDEGERRLNSGSSLSTLLANISFKNLYLSKIYLQFIFFLFATNCTNAASHLTRIYNLLQIFLVGFSNLIRSVKFLPFVKISEICG